MYMPQSRQKRKSFDGDNPWISEDPKRLRFEGFSERFEKEFPGWRSLFQFLDTCPVHLMRIDADTVLAYECDPVDALEMWGQV